MTLARRQLKLALDQQASAQAQVDSAQFNIAMEYHHCLQANHYDWTQKVPMKMLSVAQFCSTQAVNWPVWRMMNRAGVRIVPGRSPKDSTRMGGYEPTAVFDGTVYLDTLGI